MAEAGHNRIIEQIRESSMGSGIKPNLPKTVSHVDDREAVRRRFRLEWDRFKHLFDPDEPETTSSGHQAMEGDQAIQPIKKEKPGKMLWPPAPSRGFWEKKKDSA